VLIGATQDTQTGRFLAGIFGWDRRPSIEQVVVYLAYLVPVLVMFFKKPRSAAPAPQRTLDHATV
jgi:high-affinity iron transporter